MRRIGARTNVHADWNTEKVTKPYNAPKLLDDWKRKGESQPRMTKTSSHLWLEKMAHK